MIGNVREIRGNSIRVTRRTNTSRGKFHLILEDVHLQPGDRLALIGPNGSGKTTALSVLSLALRPNAWNQFEFIAGKKNKPISLNNKLTQEIKRKRIGVAQQSGGNIPFLTVRDRLKLRMSLAKSSNKRYRLRRALSEFGLERLSDRKPENLSQGQRQRVSLATACIIDPRFIFADEPTAAMDNKWSAQTFKHLSLLAQERETCVLVATHNPDLAVQHGFKLVSAIVSSNEGSPDLTSTLSIKSPA